MIEFSFSHDSNPIDFAQSRVPYHCIRCILLQALLYLELLKAKKKKKIKPRRRANGVKYDQRQKT